MLHISHGVIYQHVIMLRIIMLFIIMLFIIMLFIIMLRIIMSNVVKYLAASNIVMVTVIMPIVVALIETFRQKFVNKLSKTFCLCWLGQQLQNGPNVPHPLPLPLLPCHSDILNVIYSSKHYSKNCTVKHFTVVIDTISYDLSI
jgi:hypothetical protein